MQAHNAKSKQQLKRRYCVPHDDKLHYVMRKASDIYQNDVFASQINDDELKYSTWQLRFSHPHEKITIKNTIKRGTIIWLKLVILFEQGCTAFK